MQEDMLSIIKDLISLLIYIFVCPFRRNRKAVLVYHSVDNIPPEKDPGRVNVRPELFERQMAYIARRKDRFIVTIDDGYGNIYVHAWPVIRRLDIRTILFLTTDFIDGKISFDGFFGRKHSPRPLTWAEIGEMAAGGVELGCHSLSHRNIARLDDETALTEIRAPRERIKAMTGSDAARFSYPFGNATSFSKRTDGLLRSAGFEKAYINIMGMDNTDKEPLRIKRIRVYGTDNMFRFAIKTAGAYNWVDLIASALPGCKAAQDPCN